MTRLIFIILASICFSVTIQAQELSSKKHENLANQLFKTRNYADAAAHYESAWRGKTSKKELIYKAGECYYFVRNFKKAALALENIKDDNASFKDVGLLYARCLKQDGQYDAASREFVYFLNSYNGTDKAQMANIVQNEIRGCELGISETANPSNSSIVVEHLGPNINTDETEFAPIPFSDGILYFSSMMQGKAKIYRSQQTGGTWSEAKLPRGFSNLGDRHFCNGSFTPDTKRFYFTICNDEQNWGGLTSRCDIYVTKRKDSSWSKPEKLGAAINKDGVTNTHPLAVHQGSKEILYFSSNRTGGEGKMDLWFVERDLNNDGISFSAPINAGPIINTSGDEITPFYDPQTRQMYFSSNGHVSLGGYDIFKAAGTKNVWENPTNLGMPTNSPADDSYYVHTMTGEEGYLVSNRTFNMEKINTTQEDIFSFSTGGNQLFVKGNVYDNASQQIIKDVTVALYEMMPNGERRLWSAKDFDDGSFNFRLIPQKKLIVEATKEGYVPSAVEFDTFNETNPSYLKEIFMFKEGSVVASSSTYQPSTTTASTTTNIGTTPTTTGSMYSDNTSTSTTTYDSGTNSTYTSTSTSTNSTSFSSGSTTTYTTPSTSSSETTVIHSEAPIVISSDAPTTISSSSPSYSGSTYSSSPTTTYSSGSTYSNSPTYSSAPTTTYSSSPTYTTTSSTTYSNPTSTYTNISDYPDHTSKGGAVHTNTNTYYNSSPSTSVAGETYKIQLIAVAKYRKSSSRYSQVLNLGRMDTEFIPDKGWTRVLLADFYSESEARAMLETVRERGFEGAFIVKYRDGIRGKRVR